jgi:coniferyl-aldehyde dehydrogenase
MATPGIQTPGIQTMDLRRRFDTQRNSFERRAPSYRDRIGALRTMENSLLRRKDEIVQVISDDFGGRAAEETLALDLFPVLHEIRHTIKHLKDWMTPRRAPIDWQFWPARGRVEYQPLGVVGILAAWNYPLFLGLGPLANALAAGNHVLLKPSELAPRSADFLVSFLADLFPQEYVAVVIGGTDVAAEFSALPFEHLLYTGSAHVGKLVMRAASENLTPVTLELGGKSPALIHRDFPVQLAAERILAAKLYNAGQTCVAPDYVLVAEDRRDEFLSAARRVIEKMYPRLVANPDYTRIINYAHYRRLRGLVDDAKSIPPPRNVTSRTVSSRRRS